MSTWSSGETKRYTRATQQIIDIHATNVEAESLLSDRTGLVGKLEKSVREAFRGKDVNPYIYTVQPEFLVPEGKEHLFRNQRSSSLISIGTQRGFYPTVHKLVHNLQTNPSFCKKQRLVVLNKYFSPTFDIDWCRTRIRNVTMLHDFVEGDVRSEQHYDIDWVADLQVTATPAQPIREISAISDGYSFWESVLVFPLIAGTIRRICQCPPKPKASEGAISTTTIAPNG
ncbi:hypothetical protein ANCCAN_24545 [Ancylostoma caninum]|uniref:Uncharacterized protein n=1 Tax=Ancylostoma caninum TaxID=29170 RepID=A0A368FC02_ANCCA|nr:hypothetical protein ANCCAN_24545 [Ancylostoma caninum]